VPDEILGIVDPKPEPPTTGWCWVRLRSSDAVEKGDMVIVEDAKREGLRFVGQVVEITNVSEALAESSRWQLLKEGVSAEKYIQGALSRPEYFTALAKVKLLYQLTGSGMELVSTSPTDTSRVKRAGKEVVVEAFGLRGPEAKDSICLGALYTNEDVPVCLPLNRFLGGHIAVFGQTWSGKSYAVGKIVEEVSSKGVPIVIFDHMGEYLDLDKTPEGGSSGINVIRVSITRSGAGYVKIAVDPEDLIGEPRILAALGITDAQLNLLRDAYGWAVSKGFRGLQALNYLLSIEAGTGNKQKRVTRIYKVGREHGYSTATIDGLRWKLHSILDKGILGQGYDITKIVKQNHVTVVDLSDVEEASLRTLMVANLLSRIVGARKRDLIPPTVVVLEEAHNYVSSEETPSSILVRDLIRGARHIGVGVILVSQRPAGMHRDAINVANTHIIFRLKGTDLEYIKQFAPLTREELEEIPLLPEGVAYIAGPIIRGGYAIKVRIGKRRTLHGGHSISFI